MGGGGYAEERHSQYHPAHPRESVNRHGLNEYVKRGKFCYMNWKRKAEQGVNELDILVHFNWDYLIY